MIRHVPSRVSLALTVCGVVVLCLGATVLARHGGQAQVAGPTADELAILQEEGEATYAANCAACHGAEGVDGLGPKLAGSPSLAMKEAVIRRILEGSPTKGMPPFASLTDRQIAALGTFVRTSWENAYGAMAEADVKKVRAEIVKKPISFPR